MEPTTGYAALGDERIAYQIIGDGPIDLVVTAGWYGTYALKGINEDWQLYAVTTE